MKRCVFIIFSLLLINILFISADVCTINPSCAYFKDGSISVGGGHTCGIRSNDSKVLCWGNSGNGILGNGQISPNRAEPYPIADTSAYLTVSAGYAYTCGIRATDSRVLCWGYGGDGRLGNGGTGIKSKPTLTTDISAYTSVSVAEGHACGIRASDSRVLCWGNGTFGQLGNGGTGNYLIPTLTIDSSPYKSISVGSYHTCGIRASDSRVLCWGNGTLGQLGNGGTGNSLIPILTTDSSAYSSISAGGYHTCGIRASDSRVLCWGDSEFGKLGDGQMYIDRTSPYLTTDTFAYLQVNAGWTHTCGIRASDSRVLCWGGGIYGQLGNGGTTNLDIFKKYPTLTADTSAYTSISSGFDWRHTCGIRANDSRVLCWGQGVDGRLGDGNLATHNVFSPNLTKDISAYGCSFICVACVPSCACAVNTPIGSTCSDGCGGTCAGTKCVPSCVCAVNTPIGSTCSDGCGGTCAGTKCVPSCVCAVNTPIGSTCSDGCGGTCSGTKCIPNCSCAVNTCTGQICSDGCSGNCSGTKICADCGNGIKESPEECDDNNLVNGDGCSNVCILQPEAYFLDFNGLRITEAHIGETVKLVLNNTGILNGSFEIFEDDPAFDDEIRTGINAISGAFSNVGFGMVLGEWTITEEDYAKTNDYDGFYFNIDIYKSNYLVILANDLTPLCDAYQTEVSCNNCNYIGCNAAEKSVNEKVFEAFPEVWNDTRCGDEIEGPDPSCTYLMLCECVWNSLTGKCDYSWKSTPGFNCGGSNTPIIGICKYSESTIDNCEDGFLEYSWTTIWSWGADNGYLLHSNGPSNDINDYILENGIYYYDPFKFSQRCIGGSNIIPCPAKIQLPFFGFYNLIMTIFIIAGIYSLIYLRKSKKSL